MKKYMILFLICLLQTILLHAQTFTYKGKDLFGTQQFLKDSLQRSTNLLFHDLDSDGDQDLILSGIDSIKYDPSGNITSFSQISYFITVQENTGTKWSPKFAKRKPFMDSFPFKKGYFFPVAGDLNDDHKLDFIVGSGLDSSNNHTTLYYQRKETTGKDQFNIITGETMGLDPFFPGSFLTPALADMDKDGDLDIFMSGYMVVLDANGDKMQQPVFLYAKNTGSKSNPVFIGWYQNTNGLEKSLGENQFISIGDIDNDNDNDFISLTSLNNTTKLLYIENVARPDGKADFKLSKPLPGIPTTKSGERYYPPSLVDIDGDGDLDLFMLQDLTKAATGIGFYENNFCATLINTVTQTPKTLTANLGGVLYQWFDCVNGTDIQGATGQSFTPVKNGKYGVKLTDAKGCKNTSACIDFVITAIEEGILSNQINLYPNPASNYLTISNQTGYTLTNIQIINLDGKLVKTIPNHQINKISTTTLHPGNYIMEIHCNGNKIFKKFEVVR